VLTPERWQLVERIFNDAMEVSRERRAAFVDSHCGADEDLKRDVVSLLDADSRRSGSGQWLAAHAAAEWAAENGGEPLIGREIDGYRIESLLGAGGMGVTYLAEDAALGRKAALKLLPKAFSGDVMRVRRFIEEARSASALSHPGIITVYGMGVFEDRRYIATEFIQGETVRERLAKGTLPANEALDIAIQAAAALGAAHDARIIHRDIKPENIMIRRDGYVKIIDFGIAKLIEAPGAVRPPLTQAGGIVGTIDYMAPEQASGEPVDARTDLYSLTVVLYEMMTGELPGDPGGGSGSSWPGRPGKLRSSVLRVIRKGVTRDPAKRYQTAQDLQSDLNKVRARVARRYNHVGALLMTALAILLTAAGVYRWTEGKPAGAIKSLLVMPLKTLGSPDQAHLEEGMTEAIITRLGGLQQIRVLPAAAIRPNEDAFEAATRLRVAAVLTGSVQRAGDRLRITAQLSRVADRGEIWARQYDEAFTSIFAIQDAIAQRVATSLVTELSPDDRARLIRHDARNADAYDLYLRAREQWARRTPASIALAIRMYQQAIAIEPDFALAYAGRADCYNLAVSGMAPLTRAPLARAAAERALALDPTSAEAHTAMAFLEYKFEWKWEEADREFRRAVELNPRYTLAHHWYGEFLKLQMRHDESIRQFEQAMALDPFSIPLRYDFILALLNAGRIGQARKLLDESRAIDPNAARIFAAGADVLTAEGKPAEALEQRFRSMLLAGTSEGEINALRAAFRSDGMRGVYLKEIQLTPTQTTPGIGRSPFVATAMADLYVRLRDRGNSLIWLNEAANLREDETLTMKTHPFDFLRGDPEFIALEKRVGLLQ
jgi:eukaryotic-like serine/threonine-protein kinase